MAVREVVGRAGGSEVHWGLSGSPLGTVPAACPNQTLPYQSVALVLGPGLSRFLPVV